MKLKSSLLVLVLACVGCQSTERFSAEQIAAMRQAGFTPNAEGWGLGLSDKIYLALMRQI